MYRLYLIVIIKYVGQIRHILVDLLHTLKQYFPFSTYLKKDRFCFDKWKNSDSSKATQQHI